MIVALLSPEVREASSTYYTRTRPLDKGHTNATAALEVYFSRTLGFTLLTVGALTVLLTGSVPLSSSLSEGMTFGFSSHKTLLTQPQVQRPPTPILKPLTLFRL
jgi:hypothetical protein